MCDITSRLILRHTNPQQPQLMLNPLRRVVLGLSALLLAIAAGVGWTAMPATHTEYPLGTITYFFILAACLLATAYSRTIRFYLSEGIYEQRESLFGFTMRRQQGEIRSIMGIRVVALHMISEHARPAPGAVNAGYRGFFDRKRRYYRLELEEHGRWLRLDDGRDGEQLQNTGKILAQLLKCPYSFEER